MPRIFMTILLWLGLMAPGLAQDIPAQESAEFQRIITSQIEAFRADDGDKAFSFAAPNVKAVFQSSGNFMAMVQQSYPQVYRPRSYKFMGAVRDPAGRPSQRVLFIGPDGQAYSAIYTMERQPGGAWQIAACAILREAGLDA